MGPKSPITIALVTLLCVIAVQCSFYRFASAFEFDWRVFVRGNERALLPSAPSSFDIPSQGLSLTPQCYCRILSFNGTANDIVRDSVLTIATKDKTAPTSDQWLAYALMQNDFRRPPIAGLDRSGANGLALLFALNSAPDRDMLLDSLDMARLVKCDLIPAYLYSLGAYGDRIKEAKFNALASAVSRDDRVFLYAIAAKYPDLFGEFLRKAVKESPPSESAIALLAISKAALPIGQEELAEIIRKILLTNDYWAIMHAALAMTAKNDPFSTRLFENFVTSDDLALASCCALAIGANLPAVDVARWYGNEGLQGVVRGHLVLGCAKREGAEFDALIDAALSSSEVVLRELGAISVGLRGERLFRLNDLFQDASYEVRACSAIGAGFRRERSTFGVLKSFVQDKHHEELTAIASLLLGARPSDAAARLLTGVDEYLYERERGSAFVALGAVSKQLFNEAAPRHLKSAKTPYLRRMIAIGGLLTGDSRWLVELDKALSEYAEYRPFGHPVALRFEALTSLVNDPFDYLLDYCWEK